MATVMKYPEKVVQRALAAYDEAIKAKHPHPLQFAAGRTKLPSGTIHRWVKHRKAGYEAKRAPSARDLVRELAGLLEQRGLDMGAQQYAALTGHGGAYLREFSKWSALKLAAMKLLPAETKTAPERVFALLRKAPLTLDQIAEALAVTAPQALRGIEQARGRGYNLQLRGDFYQVEGEPGPRAHDPRLNVFASDEKGVIRYGIVSDNHIGSKYARADVLNDLYDFFQREGITRVYNCGNWIDGEARFNRHDLEPWAHGMDNQLRAFAEQYPQRKGIETYYVAGDDHEGWYDGVDVGLRAQQTARDLGRTDLHYLGYMEAFVQFKDRRSGLHSVGAFVHPGGGSAYAISYSPQKIVESYQGGEKPAVVHLGHYHKMDVFNYRNVWIMQVGCTQDQTPFMRKKRIEAHVGGILAEIRLDTRGAVTDCITWQKRYFDRGYYNHQFDRAGPLKRVPVTA